MTEDDAEVWAKLTPDDRGLVVCVVQHADTDQVLMVGYMNQTALATTRASGSVTFFSRSRQTLWTKGETSGNVLDFVELRIDCDADALLVRARPRGPTCHTGATSCFFRRVDDGAAAELAADDGPPARAAAMLARVFAVIEDRKAGRGMTHADGDSYVRRLLDKGAANISAKITEEAAELAAALAAESDERVASEAADLLFHAMVGLALRDLSLQPVADVFAARFGTSGIDEKRRRS
jgi:phosphoribosyl-ATP pyrophosphohydrolase/phosphoribosyl-AMP cyclohydrolase